MNRLSGRCGNVWGSMALGAVVLGATMSMVPATGHAAGRGDGARHEAAAVAKPRAVAPRSVAVANPPAGCNEALDALALCRLTTATATATGAAKRPGVDGTASDRRATDAAPARPVVKATVAAPGAIAEAPAAAVEAPARLLPVFALGLAIAGALLGWLGVRAISSSARGRVPERANAFRIGAPKRSATAAVAKERLLHFRTAPN